MNTNSNQGPPDLDVVFRELFSHLLKIRDRFTTSEKRNPLKRLLEQGKKQKPEKRRKSGQAVATTNDNRPAQAHVQRQPGETRTVPTPTEDTVTSKTESGVEQRIAAYQRSQPRPADSIKADQVLGQNVNAKSSRAWLHDPRALRQAFVLKELLEPPIALRKRDRRRYT